MNSTDQDGANNSLDLSEKQFSIIAGIAHENAGLVFPMSKRALVSSRLVKRLRENGFSDFQDYCNFVASQNGMKERRLMISALTTNISSFFREKHHFDILKNDTLPELIQNAQNGGRLRIWSAGSSIGMEAYSIAMSILDVCPNACEYDIKILASDIDPKVLEIGKKGAYDMRQLEAVPDDYKRKFFTSHTLENDELFALNSNVRSLVSFRELNLLAPWPFKGNFDVVFCRNTVIYFDDTTQDKLWPRFQNSITESGWLFIGHSERIPDSSHSDFKSYGMTIYRRDPLPPTRQQSISKAPQEKEKPCH